MTVIETPPAEIALLVIFSVSGAVPDALEYLTVMVQEPPGAMLPVLQLSVSVKALPAPCANASDVMVRFRLPVFVTVVVWVALKVLIFIVPAFTSNLVTVPTKSET